MTYKLAKKLRDAGYKGYLHFNGDGSVTYADTPSEAVARLWLQLNKKD